MEASSTDTESAHMMRKTASWTKDAVRESFFGPPQRYVEVGDCSLAYRVFGDGPDVVFIHGWPLHSATFRELVPVLATQFRCHLLDLPGAGQSTTVGRQRISLRAHVKTMRVALDRLGIARYALVAHDSGAVVARMLAAEDQRATALVFGGSEIPGHHPNLLKVFLWAARLRLDLVLLAAMALPFVRRSRLGFGGAFHDPRHTRGDFHELFVAPLQRAPARAASHFELLRHFDWSLIDGLRAVHQKIRVPTLLIWGEHDPYFPVAKAREMAAQFAGKTEFVALAKASVYVHEERASEFAERARVFLSRASAS